MIFSELILDEVNSLTQASYHREMYMMYIAGYHAV